MKKLPDEAILHLLQDVIRRKRSFRNALCQAKCLQKGRLSLFAMTDKGPEPFRCLIGLVKVLSPFQVRGGAQDLCCGVYSMIQTANPFASRSN